MFKLLSNESLNGNGQLNLSLDEIAKKGAKLLLAKALEEEVAEYVERHSHLRDDDGQKRVVRNGRSKERNLTFGCGTIAIKAPRVNDRREGYKFSSTILPPWARRSPNVESVLPLLYLRGLSGNAFSETLKELLGDGVKGLSKSSISSLKNSWTMEMAKWKKTKISDDFVYLWADGVNVNIRVGEDKKLCLLVIVGVNSSGKKQLLAVEGGHRESAESWRIVLRNLVSRGLKSPLLMIGDGALGLWKAVGDIPEFTETKWQRCWFHKMANVLNTLPKRLQPQAKSLLRDMMNAPEKEFAEESRDVFIQEFKAKYPKAVECLTKDWDCLVSFFNFPAANWQHLKTTNPIESTFATVKQRTRATKGAGSKEMAEAMAFKMMREAEKRWKRIRGSEELRKLLSGTLYKNGKVVENKKIQRGAA